jgi:hypothetical protein
MTATPPLPPGEGRGEGVINAEAAKTRTPTQIYHFLLPDPGMADYKDKTAKALNPDAFERIKKWRKQFTRPFDAEEIRVLLKLSEKIDLLWAEHAKQLAADRDRTEDALAVWPRNRAEGPITTTSEKDRVRANGIFNENSRTASAYRRLKLVMDYWCALWFWPIDKTDMLPDRVEFLMEIGLLILGNVLDTGPQQGDLDLTCDPPLPPGEGHTSAQLQANKELSHTETRRHGVKNGGEREIDGRSDVALAGRSGAQSGRESPPTSGQHLGPDATHRSSSLLRASVSPCLRVRIKRRG